MPVAVRKQALCSTLHSKRRGCLLTLAHKPRIDDVPTQGVFNSNQFHPSQQVATGKGRVINCLLAKAGEQLDFSPVCLNVLSWLARRRMEDWRTGELNTRALKASARLVTSLSSVGSGAQLHSCWAGWRGGAWREWPRLSAKRARSKCSAASALLQCGVQGSPHCFKVTMKLYVLKHMLSRPSNALCRLPAAPGLHC